MLQGCGFYVYPGWTRMGECWRREKDASSNAFVGKVTNLLWFSSEKNGKAESGSREEARKARKEKKQGEGWHANGSVKNKSKALHDELCSPKEFMQMRLRRIWDPPGNY